MPRIEMHQELSKDWHAGTDAAYPRSECDRVDTLNSLVTHPSADDPGYGICQ